MQCWVAFENVLPKVRREQAHLCQDAVYVVIPHGHLVCVTTRFEDGLIPSALGVRLAMFLEREGRLDRHQSVDQSR